MAKSHKSAVRRPLPAAAVPFTIDGDPPRNMDAFQSRRCAANLAKNMRQLIRLVVLRLDTSRANDRIAGVTTVNARELRELWKAVNADCFSLGLAGYGIKAVNELSGFCQRFATENEWWQKLIGDAALEGGDVMCLGGVRVPQGLEGADVAVDYLDAHAGRWPKRAE